jgi:hypothetical protein
MNVINTVIRRFSYPYTNTHYCTFKFRNAVSNFLCYIVTMQILKYV